MIHKYKLNGLNIVLDVDTSTVLTVDDLTYALMDGYPEKTRNELIEAFGAGYSREEIGECLDELDSLKAEGLLFTAIKYQKNHYQNGDLIKSMCLHVAHDCNLKCNYCFAAQGDFDGEKMLMPLEVGKKSHRFYH